MPQDLKYKLNTSDSNTASPDASLQSDGWQEDQILGSKDQNVYIMQGSNWAGDFKTLSTIASSTLDLSSSGDCDVFDFISLTNVSGCTVNFDLTTIGTGKFAVGQIITLYNNSEAISYYTVNSLDPQPISPKEMVQIMIKSAGEVLNLTDLADTTYPGKVDLRLNSLAQRGWLNIGNSSVTKTIGSPASTATFKSDTYEALYSALWKSFPDTVFGVLPGGRGLTAAADFAANKYIDISSLSDRVLAFDGLSPAGTIYGVPEVTLSLAQSPVHNHEQNPHEHYAIDVYTTGGTGALASGGVGQIQATLETNSVAAVNQPSGGGLPHENRQPTFVPYIFLKL